MKKMSNVKAHIIGQFHLAALKEHAETKLKKIGLVQFITDQKPTFGIGSMTPITTDVRRLEMCFMFLNESLPFNKLENSEPNSLRAALEENSIKLPKRSVADLIPQCLTFEVDRWLNELPANAQVTLFFDGTCHVAEMMNVVVRFISKDNKICHRLGALRMLKKSLTGNALFASMVFFL
jgi:hypothetical protein